MENSNNLTGFNNWLLKQYGIDIIDLQKKYVAENGGANFELIIEVVSTQTGIDRAIILSSSRKREAVFARHLVMAAMYDSVGSGYSLKKIGNLVNRDHSSVIHGRDTIMDLYVYSKKDKATIDSVYELLGMDYSSIHNLINLPNLTLAGDFSIK